MAIGEGMGERAVEREKKLAWVNWGEKELREKCEEMGRERTPNPCKSIDILRPCLLSGLIGHV